MQCRKCLSLLKNNLYGSCCEDCYIDGYYGERSIYGQYAVKMRSIINKVKPGEVEEDEVQDDLARTQSGS